MEVMDFKTVVFGIFNMLVTAVYAGLSRWLHKRSMTATTEFCVMVVKAFREELAEERKLFREALAIERKTFKEGFAQLSDQLVAIRQDILVLKERDK